MAAASEETLRDNKKLARFLNAEKTPRKRLRTALEFIRHATPGVVHQFFAEYNSTLYQVVVDTVTQYERLAITEREPGESQGIMAKLKRKVISLDDWMDVFFMFRSLLAERKQWVARKWQYNGFLLLLRKFLHERNAQAVREQGMLLLLDFIDCLAVDYPEGAHVDLLRACLTWQPLAARGMELVTAPVSSLDVAGEEAGPLVAFEIDTPVTEDNEVALLELVLTHSRREEGQTRQRFEYWLNLLQRLFLSNLLPEVCRAHGFKAAEDQTGFPRCPLSCQRVLATWLTRCCESALCRDVLWGTDGNEAVVLEMLRQRFLSNDLELVAETVRTYQQWCAESFADRPPRMTEDPQRYYLTMVRHAQPLFWLDGHEHLETPALVALLSEGITVFATAADQRLTSASWDALRELAVSVMDTCYAAVASPANAQTVEAFVRVLFLVFQKGVHTVDDSIYTHASENIDRWLTHPELPAKTAQEIVDCWAKELLRRTKSLMRWLTDVYGDDAENAEQEVQIVHAEVQRIKAGLVAEGARAARHASEGSARPQALEKRRSTLGDAGAAAAAADDGESKEAHLARQLIAWDHLAHAISPATVVSLPMPKVHVQVMRGLSDAVKLLIQEGLAPGDHRKAQAPVRATEQAARGAAAKQMRDKKSKEDHSPLLFISPSTLMALFGPWIFPSAQRDDARFDYGRAVALEMVCRIACTRCEARVAPHHVDVLVAMLRSGLAAAIETQSVQLLTALVRHGNRIFTMDFPGVALLAPEFVRVAGVLLDPDYNPTPPVGHATHQACVHLLGSLIPLSSRYPGVGRYHGDSDKSLKSEVFELFARIVATPSDSSATSELRCEGIWALHGVLHDEVLRASDVEDPAGTEPLVRQCLELLWNCGTDQQAVGVATTALGALQAAAAIYDEFAAINVALVEDVIVWLATQVQHWAQTATQQLTALLELGSADLRGALDSSLTLCLASLACMSDWLQTNPLKSLEVSSVRKVVFQAIELSMSVGIARGDWERQLTAKRELEGRPKPALMLQFESQSAVRAALAQLDPEAAGADDSLVRYRAIVDNAEALLLLLLNQFGQFPLREGTGRIGSQATEFTAPEPAADDGSSGPPTFTFCLRGDTLVTVIGKSAVCEGSIVLRDQTGTYTWNVDAIDPVDVPDFGELVDGAPAPGPAAGAGAQQQQQPPEPPQPEAKSPGTRSMSVAPKRPNVSLLSRAMSESGLETGDEPAAPAAPGARHRASSVSKTTRVAMASSVDGTLRHKILRGRSRSNSTTQGVLLRAASMKTLYPEAEAGGDEFSQHNPLSAADRSLSESALDSVTLEAVEVVSVDGDVKQDVVGRAEVAAPRHRGSMVSRAHQLTPVAEDALESKTTPQEQQPDTVQLPVISPGLSTDLAGDRLADVIDEISTTFEDCHWAVDKDDPTLLGNSWALAHHADEPAPSPLDLVLHDDGAVAQFLQFLKKEFADESLRFWFAVEALKRPGADVAALAREVYAEYISDASDNQINIPSEMFAGLRARVEAGDLTADMFDAAQAEMVVRMQRDNFHRYSQTQVDALTMYGALRGFELRIRMMQAAEDDCAARAPISWAQALPAPAPAVESLSPFAHCRLFLAHLGLLHPLCDQHVRMLESGPKLARSLRHLDQQAPRETIKMGVIYVGPGQVDQADILRNCGGSPEYEEFVAGLGWNVELASHPGFTGGLDANPKTLSNGPLAPYYASATEEVLFHVVTMMPVRENDEQVLSKKRHVGNDQVQIVWVQGAHARPYNPYTITSQFNDAQIVIYPLHESHPGMYRIQIHAKSENRIFGPLTDGMVVGQKALPALVRATAIRAHKRIRRNNAGVYQDPYPTRKALIDEILQRYGKEQGMGDLMYRLF